MHALEQIFLTLVFGFLTVSSAFAQDVTHARQVVNDAAQASGHASAAQIAAAAPIGTPLEISDEIITVIAPTPTT